MAQEDDTRRSAPPQQVLLLGGVVLTVVLGFIGWTELMPALSWDERLFKALNLIGLGYDAPPGSVPPPTLNVARFLAHFVAFYAFGSVVNNLFRERGVLFRASLSRDHVVIVGDAPEVPRLALNYRHGAGVTKRVVVVADLSAETSAHLGRQGVLVVRPMPQQALSRVLKGAAVAVVAGTTDHETARLATQVEKASTDPGFPTTVVFDGRDITHQWNQGRAGSAICRSTQVAIQTLRLVPPRPAEHVSPPPIVIGEGTTAAEIVRRIVVGWQELGERMPVHCLGTQRGWLDDIEVGLEDRAELRFVPTPLNQECVVRAVRALRAEWTPPPDRKATSTGPAIVIALEDETTAFTLAVALAGAQPDARIAALVEDAAVWAPRATALGVAPILVSRNEKLADPEVLAITAESLLTEAILDDAGSWPPGIPTVFGPVTAPADGAVLRLADQPPATQQAIRTIAAHTEDVLAAGGVAARGGNSLDDRAIILSPDELRAMADRIVDLAGDETPEGRLRALELAARLPTLAARAGWAPHRPPGRSNLLSHAEIVALAPRVHEQYRMIAARTNNATGSEAADQTWAQLSAFDQESNRAQLAGAPVKLAAASLTWRRAEHPVRYAFSPEQVEFLAELEHRRWEHHQRRNGRPGHTWARPWAELTEEVRDYDRDPIRALPEVLAGVGIEIVESEQPSPSIGSRRETDAGPGIDESHS